MSRRSRRSPAKKIQPQNRSGAVSTRPLRPQRPPLNLTPIPYPSAARPALIINPLADRRTWHPDGEYRPAPATNVNARRLVASGKTIRFAAPSQVITCLRRKIRREVLFAVKVGGQKGRKARPRRNWLSAISCKG